VAVLNSWLATTAYQAMKKGASRTFVLAENPASTRIMGFYALTFDRVDSASLPVEFKKSLPESIPVYLLARMAVSLEHQGRDLGVKMLADAYKRTRRIFADCGGMGITVDAKPESAGFYLKLGFHQDAEEQHRFCLPF
jgi:GNAT superfamily N-acetyltransferase